jgi:hypothetical protein
MTFLVLLNVVFDLCACLSDAPVPLNAKSAAVATRQTHAQDLPECGDNCDSCICCAAIIVTGPVHYESVLAVVAGVDYLPAAASPEPEPHRMKRPPRT